MSNKAAVTINTTPIVLVLLVFKLAGVLQIGWWWVFSPFWIPLALAGAIVAVYFTLLLLALILRAFD